MVLFLPRIGDRPMITLARADWRTEETLLHRLLDHQEKEPKSCFCAAHDAVPHLDVLVGVGDELLDAWQQLGHDHLRVEYEYKYQYYGKYDCEY